MRMKFSKKTTIENQLLENGNQLRLDGQNNVMKRSLMMSSFQLNCFISKNNPHPCLTQVIM